jgi:predicted permease
MEALLTDIRYGLRTLRRSPGFTAVAILTLALGIGVNAAIFTGFNLELRPLPIKDPDAVAELRHLTSAGRHEGFSYLDYLYLRDHTRTFSSVMAAYPEKLLLGTKNRLEEPEEITGNFVSGNFFSELGGSARAGRLFTSDDTTVPGKDALVVLSHQFWQRRFASDSRIVGQTILLDGKPFTIVGVTASEFAGLSLQIPDVWLPLTMRAQLPTVWDMTPSAQDWFSKPAFRWVHLAARLSPGHSMAEASAEMSVVERQLASAYPEIDPKDKISVGPASGTGVEGDDWKLPSIVLSATGLVLLIACSNLANLLLARGAARHREIGVRLSLGATRARVVRQLLTESLLLAIFGGGAGLLLAWWSLDLTVPAVMTRFGTDNPARLALDFHPDWRVLSFTFLVTLLSGIASGLAPALRATRTELFTSIKSEAAASGHDRFRNGLVIAQVALCLALLIPAGVLLRGLVRALSMQPGFETKKLLIVGYSLELSGYDQTRARLFQEQLLARLGTLPGVESVSPGGFWSARATISPRGASAGGSGSSQLVGALYQGASSSFFQTLGIPIVRGRAFTAEEVLARFPVVVVSESTARSLWPRQDPLGQILHVERPMSNSIEALRVSTDAQVIGIARDAHNSEIGSVPPQFVYVPLDSDYYLDTWVLVRTSRDAAAMKPAVRREVHALEPVIRLWLESGEEMIGSSNGMRRSRVASDFAAALGMLALTLAGVGIYGVISYSVVRRTREIGIRMALGSPHAGVVRLILRQGFRLVAIGTGVGLALGAAASQLLRSLLFGMSPFDPAAYASICAFLGAVTLTAIYLPARRAANVDPMVALRHD